VADAVGTGVVGAVATVVGVSVADGIGGDGVAVPVVGLVVALGDVEDSLGVGFFFFVRVGVGVGVGVLDCVGCDVPPVTAASGAGGGRTSR
jgi:hypothetical protein